MLERDIFSVTLVGVHFQPITAVSAGHVPPARDVTVLRLSLSDRSM